MVGNPNDFNKIKFGSDSSKEIKQNLNYEISRFDEFRLFFYIDYFQPYWKSAFTDFLVTLNIFRQTRAQVHMYMYV